MRSFCASSDRERNLASKSGWLSSLALSLGATDPRRWRDGPLGAPFNLEEVPAALRMPVDDLVEDGLVAVFLTPILWVVEALMDAMVD